MSRPPINATPSDHEDQLLQRYEEANTLDPARPGDALRETVLAHARRQAAAASAPLKPQTTAANDAQWKLRALGSLAVVGFMGLLVMQFERGTPEEQTVALGVPSPRADAAMAKTEAESSNNASIAKLAEATPPEEAAAEEKAQAAPKPAAPSPAPLPAAPVAKAAAPSPPQEPLQSMQPEAPAAIATMPSAERIESIETSEAAETPQPVTPAAPAATMDAMPSMAQAEAPQPMTPAPSPARARAEVSESRRAARREPARESSATGSALKGAVAPSLPLHAAVAASNVNGVQSLLAQGVEINARDRLGRTALMLAAMGPSKQLVEILIAAGTDTTLRDAAGLNAADHAARAGHVDWLPLLAPPGR